MQKKACQAEQNRVELRRAGRRFIPERAMGRFPSGQRGQTVNLLAFAFDGSNPSLPIPLSAEVAQLVEQHLDMVEVVGSSPIPRSEKQGVNSCQQLHPNR